MMGKLSLSEQRFNSEKVNTVTVQGLFVPGKQGRPRTWTSDQRSKRQEGVPENKISKRF